MWYRVSCVNIIYSSNHPRTCRRRLWEVDRFLTSHVCLVIREYIINNIIKKLKLNKEHIYEMFIILVQNYIYQVNNEFNPK